MKSWKIVARAARWAALPAAAVLSTHPAFAMAKKAPAPAAALTGKRVLRLEPVRNVRIQMPDQKYHDFGDDFAQKLENDLSGSGRYIVDVPSVTPQLEEAQGALSLVLTPPPDFEWPSSVVPAATLTLSVEAMSFSTGARGDRVFYGFNERFRTPFNDGFTDVPNEFPLKTDAAGNNTGANWFDHAFDQRGSTPFDSRSGLDLGNGFQIDALFAWLSVKYATYHAELHLKLGIDAPLAGRSEYRVVTVTGEGYFYDIAGAYEGYSLGISVARTDAMGQALKNAIGGVWGAIDRATADLPLTGRIDAVTADGTVLIGSGPDAAVVPGTRYELIGHEEVLLEAILSNSSGTMAKVVQGDPANAVPGTLVRESIAGQAPATVLAQQLAPAALAAGGDLPAASEDISLPWTDFAKADLDGLAPVVTWLEAFWKSLVEAVFLPYRIWRYFQYDQAYVSTAPGADSWAQQARATAWARQIGLRDLPEMARPATTAEQINIAVIDSGVDYNHWTLHDHLWLNSAPVSFQGTGVADKKDYYGFDFIGGDAHPYDDGYHGTEVASLVSAVAPAAKLMPIKVFNPWGITSSAALYGAFQYAVDHGAQIIVCAWATPQASQAIEQGIAYARAANVVVIAAAGDLGQDLSLQPEYPAALSAQYDNVLAVAGVDSQDQLTQTTNHVSNHGPRQVGLAAPGAAIWAATPRGEGTSDTSTALSAALTAGVLAREIAFDSELRRQPPATWIQSLRAGADSLPGLDAAVAGGLRLRARH